MKAFQANGLWFLPGEPRREVAGTLRFSPRRGLRLSLIGTLSDQQGLGFGALGQYPIIHGVVSESPFGRRITLADCFGSRSTVTMPGFVSQEVVANKGYVGQEFLTSDEDFRFDSVRIHMRELNDWFPISGISQQRGGDTEDDFGLQIRYRRPDHLRFKLGQANATIGLAWQSSFRRRTAWIRERVGVVIEGLGCLSLKDILTTYVWPLRDFLTLVTYAPSSLTSLAVGRPAQASEGRQEKQYFEVLFEPIGTRSRRKRRQSTSDALLAYAEVGSDLPSLLNRWMAFHAEYRSFCHEFFHPLYAPPPYVETRFLAMVQAMTLYFAKAVPPDDAIVRLLEEIRLRADLQGSGNRIADEQEREWIADALPTEAELSLPRNLLATIDHHATLMGDLIGDDPTRFVEQVSATRRHLLRFDRREDALPLHGESLHWATEKLRVLMTACVLGQLGIPTNRVAELFRRNRVFQHLLTVN